MPFTQAELDNIANAALDYHFEKGKVESQTLQDKPLLRELEARKRTFPSGKENITVRVKGEYTTTIQGYSGDDQVSYGNPANMKTASYPYKELHSGIKVTLTELKKDGITITDTALGKGEQEHSGREMTALANLLQDKLEDMDEGTNRGLNSMYWLDGTQDSALVPGIRSLIVNDPTAAATVGGIDQVVNTWWRNRAALNLSTTTPSDQVIAQRLQREFRQLRRYGNPRHLALAGSDFLDAFEKELRSKGNYTLEGWAQQKQIDASVADIAFKGTPLQYDPTLDDLGLSKYLYMIDVNAIFPMVMEGEDKKRHNPARPADRYVLYRAMTSTLGLVCKRRNTSGVYTIV